MRITGMSKGVCSFVATLALAAAAIGQNSGTLSKRQPIGGFVSTNVGGLPARSEGQHSTPAGRVAMYLVGRAFLNPSSAQGQVVGYITDIDRIPGPLFSGTPGEATAFFTFRSDIFSLQQLAMNGDIGLNLVSPGTLSVYLNTNPAGDWSKAETFSSGQLIATFRRGESLFIQIGPAGSHVLSESLVSSRDFAFAGEEFNFDEIAKGGVTLSEFISNAPVNGVEGFLVGLPFAANAVAIETRKREGDE